jgi:radical SAM protein with 4Fe4S-binding SPASM domain
MLTFYSQHARQVRATVTFSLDAIRESTFHKLKPGANPHLILDNVYQFLVEYARLYKEFKMPFTVLLQMIILKENAEEAGEFLAYWQKILNELKLPFDVGYSAFGECEGNNPLRIVFKRASVKYQEEMTQLHHQTMMKLGLASPEEKSLFHLNQQQVEKEKIDTEEQTHRSPCVAVFDTMVVNWDGRVTPCCADSNLELEVGNLQENSLFGVLNNPTINALRLAHIQGDFKDFPRCSYCSNAVLPAQELERIHKRCQEAGLKI